MLGVVGAPAVDIPAHNKQQSTASCLKVAACHFLHGFTRTCAPSVPTCTTSYVCKYVDQQLTQLAYRHLAERDLVVVTEGQSAYYIGHDEAR